jgi:hypothetical protein
MTRREIIKRLEEEKCQLEEDFRFEQNQYRLNSFRNDDGGSIKHELDQCIKGLKEHQDALKGLSTKRKDAEETYERKLRTRQGELLDKICKELAEIGKSFCSFVEKVVPIINRDGVDEVLGRFSGGSNQQV